MRQPTMPWQPMHISIFCAPAAASPTPAAVWAGTGGDSASARTAASNEILVIDRLSLDATPRACATPAAIGDKTRLFYGPASLPVKPRRARVVSQFEL